MRPAEETLELLKLGLKKRHAYLRRMARRIDEAEKQEIAEWKSKGGRGRHPERYKSKSMLRGGMISEHATIMCMLREIEAGTFNLDKYHNEEDDPKEPC